MASTGEPHGLFWDDDNGDREYNAASMEYWLKKFFTTGVFEGDLQVKESSGMTLVIEPGYCNVDGKVKFWNGEFNLTLQAANSTYPRIDTIVITRDNVNRDIVCEVVTGSYSADTPQPTAPVRTSEIYQIVLAQIYVGTGVTEITQANITDTRPDNDLCGYIAGTVEQMDFSQFTAQFEAYFNEFKATHLADFSAWELAQKAAYTAWFNLVKQQQIDDKASWDAWYADLQEELHNLPADSAEYLQIQIDELRESGLSGSILHITTVNSELESKTVTVTGGYHSEERTGEFDSNLECEIAGIKSVGTVTVTSTDGIRTATSVINIPYYGYYNVPIAFWAATVNIQGDENLYGATVTVKDSDDLTVGTVTLSAVDGTGTFTATKADTYTFSVTYQGQTITETLAVTEETTYSVSLSAGFSWQTWVDTAQYLDSSSYNDLDEVLEDEEALRELFLEHNCVDYLADVTTASADVTKIFNTDLAAKWINNSDYALDTLSANNALATVMATADKYFYGEWTIVDDTTTPPTWGPKGAVPKMTSNSAPYGTASATIEVSGLEAYRAFDGDDSTYYDTRTSSNNGELTYKFVNPICVRRWKFVSVDTLENLKGRVSSISLHGSNDGNTWSNALDTVSTDALTDVLFERPCNNDSYYLQYKIVITKKNSNPIGVATLQFYGRQLSVSVPVMTSNTAPFGEASASSQYSAQFAAWKAFDGASDTYWSTSNGVTTNQRISYKFEIPTNVKGLYIVNQSNDGTTPKNCRLQYSNDGTNWTDVASFINPNSGIGVRTYQDTPNDIYALYWGLFIVDNYGGNYIYTRNLQFYGLDYSEKEFEAGTNKKWLYDHGVQVTPLSGVNGSSGTAPVFGEDSIILQSGSASSNSFSKVYPTTSFDLTSYDSVRAKIGDLSNSRPYMDVTTSPSGGTMIAERQQTVADLPFNLYLDISAIDQTYPVEANMGSGTNGKCELKEFWVE